MNELTRVLEKEIIKYIGIPKGKETPQIKEQVRRMWEELARSANPRTTHGLFSIEVKEEIIIFKDLQLTIKSKDLARVLKGANQCYIIAATLGAQVDRAIVRLQKQDMSDALIFNAAGSAYIEVICDQMEKEIIAGLAEGHYLTMRYSPGYGDVPITLQQSLLNVIDATRRIGLTVTKSGMLLPEKSITAFIGITKEKQNRMKTCGECHLRQECMYRKRGERCGID